MYAFTVDLRRQLAAAEVVPEAAQLLQALRQIIQYPLPLGGDIVGGSELSVQLLEPCAELLVELEGLPLSLAFLLLTLKLTSKLRELQVAGAPEPSQLVENECGVTRLRIAEQRFERIHLLLRLPGPSLLLLEALLKFVNLVLQVPIRLLETGAVLEELYQTFFFGLLGLGAEWQLERPELVEDRHVLDPLTFRCYWK